jgi:ferredoxin-NADP reductase
MYRLVLYYLIALAIGAVVLSFFKQVQYNAIQIILSAFFLVAVCGLANDLFGFIFKAPRNVESVFITALILLLIVPPAQSLRGLLFLAIVSVLAMASKFILTINRKHIFNPAAIAVLVTSYGISQSANWWVGTPLLMPIVVIGGLLVVHRIQKFDMVFYFLLTTVSVSILLALVSGGNIPALVNSLFLHSSLLFFAFVMLTEPMTTPHQYKWQVIYAVLLGILFVQQIHVGNIYFTPELALVLGNILVYLVNPKRKLFLHLLEKIQIAPDMEDFVFEKDPGFNFIPGRFMEWTFPHKNVDTRGNRRFLTIASSPTETNIRLGLKFYQTGSSYKRAITKIDNSNIIVGDMLAGEFTLPDPDKNGKYVFIAGGIGVTPFRSMLKYLTDMKIKQDIVLLYSNSFSEEVIYRDVFDAAAMQLGIKVIYCITKATNPTATPHFHFGRIDQDLISREIPDYSERTYYVSGSLRLVDGIKDLLHSMGIKQSQTITDFFPGLA